MYLAHGDEIDRYPVILNNKKPLFQGPSTGSYLLSDEEWLSLLGADPIWLPNCCENILKLRYCIKFIYKCGLADLEIINALEDRIRIVQADHFIPEASAIWALYESVITGDSSLWMS